MPFDIQALEQQNRKILAASEAAIHTALYEVSQRAVRRARLEAPKRTGALAAANEFRVVRLRNGRVARIKNRQPYAAAIDRGARPHIIRGRPWLVFRGRDGGFVRVRSVNHPGNKPFRFLQNAVSSAYVSFPDRYAAAMHSRL